jgi:hypothetical protein
MSDLSTYKTETVLEFIQTTIRNSNNVEKDILIHTKIPYIEGKVTETVITTKDGKTTEEEVTEDRSTQGFYYERLWDLCIKFGATSLTLPSIKVEKKDTLQTSHIINENPNNEGIYFKENCWANNILNKNPGGYLSNKVRSGNSGGYSDITFFNKKYDETGKEYEELSFISVKYFKEEKQIGDYDIGKLCTLIKKHEKENRVIKLYIFVKDKNAAIEKFNAQRASSNILIKYINPHGNHENIYDIHDLQSAFFKLKKILEPYNYLQTEENIQSFSKDYLNVLKGVFIPRFHQQLFILKINKLVENGEKNVLVGAIPRSGKSYIMAGTILEYIKTQEELDPIKKLKIIMMTPAPNETFNEYQSIFDNYIEFNKLDVVTYNDKFNISSLKSDKHTVIIISKQKIGWSSGNKAEEILEKDEIGTEVDEDVIAEKGDVENEDEIEKDVKNINKRIIQLFGSKPDIDMMFLDEAHFGMSTPKAEKIVNGLNNVISNTIKIYVTATYNKPLHVYGVKANCKITWDMNDIKIMKDISIKNINDNAIRDQFGATIYDKTLKQFEYKYGDSLIESLKKEYGIFPKPYMITTIWDKDYLNVEKLKIKDRDFGWDMKTLFSTNGSTFVNEGQMKEMMRYYFGYPDKKEKYNKQAFYRTRGIIPRIRNICTNNCRTLQPQHKTTQLWFLPLGSGKIKDKINALITLLTGTNEFKDIKNSYHFFVAVEDKRKKDKIDGVTYMGNPHDIKRDIEAIEKQIEKGEIKQDNLIILAGQRLQLGISLRNVDIVTLWNSIESSDAIFQILFRSMTEVESPECIPNDYCSQKKFGFMVDMNPQRSIKTTSLFGKNLTKNISNNIDKETFTQIISLINIDEDVLIDKYGKDTSTEDREKFVEELFYKLQESWNQSADDMKKTISKFTFDVSKLEKMKNSLLKINITKPKGISIIVPEESIDPAKKKKLTARGKTTKDKEINLVEKAADILSEYITLLNIFTLYEDKGTKCILTDESKVNSKLDVKHDIDSLKGLLYGNGKIKDIFLKILNGRLLGDDTVLFPQGIINDVLDSINEPIDKLHINKIIIDDRKEYYNIHEPDKLMKRIDDSLRPNKEDKDKNGEVFTPLYLVNDMLDNLDESYKIINGKSIFTEQSFKWLDPAVGIGNFPIIIYLRLLKGLEPIIKDKEERIRHILEEMLYMVEISDKSIFILNKILCGDKYKLNIHRGSYLEGSCRYDFKFDVILGNPPYNPPKTETGSSGNSIWQHFVIKSYYISKEKGILLFLHPPGWRKPTDEYFDPDKLQILDGEYHKYNNNKQSIKQIRTGQVWKVLKKTGSFSFIYTNDQTNKKMNEYVKFFPAFDYYVYQKGLRVNCHTKNIFLGKVIEQNDVKINYDLDYLPNLITNETQDILNKITTKTGDKPNFTRNRSNQKTFSDNSSRKYKYIYTYKKGEPLYKYTNILSKDDNLNMNKVIMNFSGGLDFYKVSYVKKDEKIGTYDKTMYSIVENNNEGKRLLSFFNSNIVRFIFLITQYSYGAITQNEPLVANSITIPPEGVDYYKFFNIENYREFIENNLSIYKIPNTDLKDNSLHSENSKKNTLKLKNKTQEIINSIAQRKAENPNTPGNGKTFGERKQLNALKKKQTSHKRKVYSQIKLSKIVNVNSRSQKNSKN